MILVDNYLVKRWKNDGRILETFRRTLVHKIAAILMTVIDTMKMLSHSESIIEGFEAVKGAADKKYSPNRKKPIPNQIYFLKIALCQKTRRIFNLSLIHSFFFNWAEWSWESFFSYYKL